MNKYGKLLYRDRIEDMTGTVSLSGKPVRQSYSQDLQVYTGVLNGNYYDFASFEEGEFDFEKPLFAEDPLAKMPFVSSELAGASGVIQGEFEIIADSYYDGDGFVIVSFMKEYEVTITVSEEHHLDRTKTFVKNARNHADGFFPFPYEQLLSAKFSFKVKPNHFLNVTAIGFGGDRWITDIDLTKEPIITTHFSLTNEELEFDTLSFSVFNGENKFKFVPGNRIVIDKGLVDENSKTFYVNTATENEDGTIDIECYDDLGRIADLNYTGIMRTNNPVDDSTEVEWIVDYTPYQISDMPMQNPTFSGTLAAGDDKRKTLKTFLLGNTLVLKRAGRLFDMFNPSVRTHYNPHVFNNHNICSVPSIGKLDTVSKVHFSKHRYSIDRSKDKSEAFRDYVAVDSNAQRLEYSQAYEARTSELKRVDTSGGEETLVDIDPTKLVTNSNGAYFKDVTNMEYTDEIVVLAFPYNVNYTAIDVTLNVSPQFMQNNIKISDCTLALDDVNAIRNFLRYIYSFRVLLSFSSLLEVDTGDYVRVELTGQNYEGYITKKTDTLTGVYMYEILCKEVGI